MSRVLALVPARGGSKGIPRKNLQQVGGYSLVQFAVVAARASGCVDTILLSTDDAEIAEEGRRCGAAVPFLRPPACASDTAPMIDVILDAVRRLADGGQIYDYLLLLQPTTPFRDPALLAKALATLEKRLDATACVAVTPVIDAHPRRLRRIVDGWLTPFLAEGSDEERQQRQDHADAPAYRRCGAFYLTRMSTLAQGTLYGTAVAPMVVDGAAAVTIDEPIDLELARALWQSQQHWPEVAAMRAAFQGMVGEGAHA